MFLFLSAPTRWNISSLACLAKLQEDVTFTWREWQNILTTTDNEVRKRMLSWWLLLNLLFTWRRRVDVCRFQFWSECKLRLWIIAEKSLIARRARYSWEFAGCLIFWPVLFCGWVFALLFFSVLFDGRCWYRWVFYDILVQLTFQEDKNVSDKSFPQYPGTSRRFEPIGHPHLWCSLVAFC